MMMMFMMSTLVVSSLASRDRERRPSSDRGGSSRSDHNVSPRSGHSGSSQRSVSSGGAEGVTLRTQEGLSRDRPGSQRRLPAPVRKKKPTSNCCYKKPDEPVEPANPRACNNQGAVIYMGQYYNMTSTRDVEDKDRESAKASDSDSARDDDRDSGNPVHGDKTEEEEGGSGNVETAESESPSESYFMSWWNSLDFPQKLAFFGIPWAVGGMCAIPWVDESTKDGTVARGICLGALIVFVVALLGALAARIYQDGCNTNTFCGCD